MNPLTTLALTRSQSHAGEWSLQIAAIKRGERSWCSLAQQYLFKVRKVANRLNECRELLAPLSATGSSDKSGGTVAVIAGLIAAVKLARVESIELKKTGVRGCALRFLTRLRLHVWSWKRAKGRHEG
jgi:hypothetical protein